MTARTISVGNTKLSGTPRTTAVVQASGVSQLGNTVLPLRQTGTTCGHTSHRIVDRPLPNAPDHPKRRGQDHFRVPARATHQICTAVQPSTPATTPQPIATRPGHSEEITNARIT